MAKPKLKVEGDTRIQVFARALYRCERCDGSISQGASVHHRLPRQMGGSRNAELNKPANLILLCGSGVTGCHGWVESNRDKAREKGYLLFRIDSASEVPFLDLNDRAWLIDNEGQKRQLGTEEDKAYV
jgi:hypothetical protein